ncbi:MAG: hypothetical protein UHD09_09620 [Bifidobacterium sp.]|nr:hypothetical protein [Bifidobacterium sp.]
MAVTAPGAVGVRSGVAVTALDAGDQPTSFSAYTVNVYVCPLRRPSTRHCVRAPQSWLPPAQRTW